MVLTEIFLTKYKDNLLPDEGLTRADLSKVTGQAGVIGREGYLPRATGNKNYDKRLERGITNKKQ